MILVDTDILIRILRGRADIADKFESTVRETKGNLSITSIQIVEIYAVMGQKERVEKKIYLQEKRKV